MGRAFSQVTEKIHVGEAGIALAVIVGVIMAVRPPRNAEAWRYWLRVVMRYVLAYVFLDYGLSKIFKGQFTTNLSTLDMPLGQISGFELAWRFFGYSYPYAIFLAASDQRHAGHRWVLFNMYVASVGLG